MKKFMIALYSGLAVTVWLVFLPPTEEAKAPAVTLSEEIDHAPMTQQRAHQATTSSRPSQATAPAGGQAEPVAGLDTLPTADASDPAPELTAQKDAAYREVKVTPQSASGRFQITRPHMAANEEPTRTRPATAAKRPDAQAHVAGFNFQTITTVTSVDTAPESAPTASTTTAPRKSDQLVSDRPQADAESTATEAANTDAVTDTGATTRAGTTTSTTPVSDRSIAAGDDNTFLPQADTTRTPAGTDTNKPGFQCPTSCYMKCTAYEINMLTKQGCPVPTQ